MSSTFCFVDYVYNVCLDMHCSVIGLKLTWENCLNESQCRNSQQKRDYNILTYHSQLFLQSSLLSCFYAYYVTHKVSNLFQTYFKLKGLITNQLKGCDEKNTLQFFSMLKLLLQIDRYKCWCIVLAVSPVLCFL